MFIFKIILCSLIISYLIFVLLYFSIKKIFIKIIFVNGIIGFSLLLFLKTFQEFIMLNVYINSVTVISSIFFGPLGVIFNLLIDYVII